MGIKWGKKSTFPSKNNVDKFPGLHGTSFSWIL